MLNTLSTLVNSIQSPQLVCNNSDAIHYIIADIMTGSVTVEFNSGHIYKYHNVSRRAIFNLLNDKDVSMGFWVNNNCVNSERTFELSRGSRLLTA